MTQIVRRDGFIGYKLRYSRPFVFISG